MRVTGHRQFFEREATKGRLYKEFITWVKMHSLTTFDALSKDQVFDKYKEIMGDFYDPKGDELRLRESTWADALRILCMHIINGCH